MPKYKPGDRVVFINAYGVNFGERTIVSHEANSLRGDTYYIEPTDTPWFAHDEDNLYRPGDPAIEAATSIHYQPPRDTGTPA